MPAAAQEPGKTGRQNAVWCDMAARLLGRGPVAWPAGAQRQFAAPRAAGRRSWRGEFCPRAATL